MRLCITSFVWFLISCLILGVGVLGATDCAPASGSLTLKTSQDVADLTKCKTFTGNVVVAADGPNTISLDGLETISGNIDAGNVGKLQSLSSTSLEGVTSFTLNNLPQLSNLSFPALKNFTSLKWYNLPSLKDCTIATGAVEGEIQEITILNTSLSSLDWLAWPVGSQLNITSNPQLETFNIAYDSINAGSAYTLNNNGALKTIDVSSLSGIYGGLEISGNAKATLLAFEKLETINGFVQLSGAFKNVSMPALNKINGALSVESTEDITALCNNLADNKLAGHYTCTPNVQKSSSSAPSSTGTLSSPTATATNHPDADEAKGGGVSKDVKIGAAIAALAVVVLVLIAAFFYFRRRARSKVREINPKSNPDDVNEVNSVELSDSRSSNRNTMPKELESPAVRLELEGEKGVHELPGMMPQELDAGHGPWEMNTPITPVSPAASFSSVYSGTPLFRHELPA